MSAFSPASRRRTDEIIEMRERSGKARFEHTVRFDDLNERIRRMDRMLQDTQGWSRLGIRGASFSNVLFSLARCFSQPSIEDLVWVLRPHVHWCCHLVAYEYAHTLQFLVTAPFQWDANCILFFTIEY